MARKKVNLAWIPNDAVRRSTFKKRRCGLIKKVSELAILCDVKACAIIYGPHEAQPEVWPSESEARSILQHFKGLPAKEQEKKMVNQEGFLQQRVKKMVEQFQRMEHEIREIKITVLMFEGMVNGRILRDVGVGDATSLLYFIDAKLKVVHEKIKATNSQMMGADATTKELLRHNMYPAEIAAPNEQTMHGSSNVGLMFEMIKPYLNTGSQWMDPNFCNF